MKIAITMRTPDHLGGVVAYFNAVLPHLQKTDNTTINCFYLGSKLKRRSFIHAFTDQIRFSIFLDRAQPDLIHVNPSLDFKSFIRDGLIVWQAKRRHIPVLIFFHGWQQRFEYRVSGKMNWFFKISFLKADAFIVLISSVKKRLRAWGVKSKIHMGSTVVHDELLKNYDIDDNLKRRFQNNHIRILFLARIEREKGIFETIEAFQKLVKRGYRISLTVAGNGSALFDARSLSAKLGACSDKINFLGYVKGQDKINAFKKNDIYCFPSYEEGMPSSLLEAMAFGMPVITSPVGGIADFFVEGKMGYFIKKNSAVHIVKAFERLVSSPDNLPYIAKYNHEFALANFLASAAAKKLADIYGQIINHE